LRATLLIVPAGMMLAASTSQPVAATFTSAAVLREHAREAVVAMDKAEHYQSADSGTLAWGEARVLTAYYWMYEATGDTAWCDRIVGHADVIFANLSQGDELHPGWRTPRYSVALVRASAHPDNESGATIRPDPTRIYDRGTAAEVTGHTYELRVAPDGTVEVTDTTTAESIGAADLPRDGRIGRIPGVVVVVEGEPHVGDRFRVETQALKPFEYIVHDGMILTPIAKFCAAVLSDDDLASKYGAAARRYVEIMETQLLPKWEPYWHELPGGMGVYAFQDDPAQRFPGASLPHNQYLALGRTFVALHRITGKARYRERARMMGRFFKHNLRLVDEHYEWNYWDYAGPWDEGARRMAHTEDSSHGHIDIGFAVDAYDAGLVFEREDLERFARTVADVMWNRSEKEPRLGSHVNTSEGEREHALDWVRLGRFDERTRQIMVGMLESLSKPGRRQAAAAAQGLALEREGWSPQPRCAGPRATPAD